MSFAEENGDVIVDDMYCGKLLISDIETDADEVMQLRVFTQNISWLDLTFAKKITLDGVKGVLAEDAAEIIRKIKML